MELDPVVGVFLLNDEGQVSINENINNSNYLNISLLEVVPEDLENPLIITRATISFSYLNDMIDKSNPENWVKIDTNEDCLVVDISLAIEKDESGKIVSIEGLLISICFKFFNEFISDNLFTPLSDKGNIILVVSFGPEQYGFKEEFDD